MKEKDGIESRVDQMTTRNFTVSGCPEKIFKEFVQYSASETANCYWMALKQLIDLVKANAKENTLFSAMTDLDQRVTELENNSPREEGGNKLGTFGRKMEE